MSENRTEMSENSNFCIGGRKNQTDVEAYLLLRALPEVYTQCQRSAAKVALPPDESSHLQVAFSHKSAPERAAQHIRYVS